MSIVPRLVLTEKLTCPVCGALYRTADLVAGSLWVECYNKTSVARRCGATYFVIAVPPGCVGRDLGVMLGPVLALRVIRAAVPDIATWPDEILWDLALTAPDRPAYLVTAARPRDRHLHRFQPVRDVLRALAIL